MGEYIAIVHQHRFAKAFVQRTIQTHHTLKFGLITGAQRNAGVTVTTYVMTYDVLLSRVLMTVIIVQVAISKHDAILVAAIYKHLYNRHLQVS